jgi:hypothetical protein
MGDIHDKSIVCIVFIAAHKPAYHLGHVINTRVLNLFTSNQQIPAPVLPVSVLTRWTRHRPVYPLLAPCIAYFLARPSLER